MNMEYSKVINFNFIPEFYSNLVKPESKSWH